MDDLPKVASKKTPKLAVVFLEEYVLDLNPHHGDPMPISLKCKEWEIQRVLVNWVSSIEILYWDAFERLCLDLKDLKPFNGSLAGFSR